MTVATHEAEVSARFDLLHERFNDRLAPDDYRLNGLLDWLGPVEGKRILDVGSGKGRFSRVLQDRGADVVGIDLSMAMLASSPGLARVRGSARRLPFLPEVFDLVVVVEVLQHLTEAAVDAAIHEFRRVLKPGGRLAVIDKNAGSLNRQRPWLPGLLIKRIDERRGLWMYPPESPVRERWFWPRKLKTRLGRCFQDVHVRYLEAPEESRHFIFRRVGSSRAMVLWGAQASGGLDDEA